MTETSYIWNGVVTGDATNAPYEKNNFNFYLAGIHTADTDDALVIPGYLNDLDALASGGLGLSISSGAAILQNYVYINSSSVSFALTAPSSGAFRFDYIALELDSINQTVRLVVVEGIETTDPTLLENPNLTQTASLWQAALFRVYVESTVTLESFIYDERVFAVTSYTLNTFDERNLLYNSELMAIDATGLPERWTSSGSFTTLQADTKLSIMSRGQSVRSQGGTLITSTTLFTPVKPGDIYTLQGVFKIVSPAQTTFNLQGFSSLGGGNVVGLGSLQFENLEADDEVIFTLRTKLANSVTVYGFRITMFVTGGDVSIGQLTLVRGYHPGPFKQQEECLVFQTPVTDASWSDTAKSTSTTTIDFTSDFGALIQPQTKAVILRVRGRDSGSGAGTPYISILGYNASFPSEYGRLDLQGVTNDVYRELVCVAPVNQPLFNAQSEIPQLRIDIGASGAGTLDATVEVMGIFI